MSEVDQSMVGLVVAPTLAGMLASHQVEAVKKAVASLREPELADIIIQLDEKTRAKVFRLIKADRTAEVFSLLPQDVQESLMDMLRDKEVSQILNELEPDDRVELLEDIEDEEQFDRVMKLLRPEDRVEAEQLLAFPEESVGREMTTKFLSVQSDWSAARTLDYIREAGPEVELLTIMYVVDENGRLLGAIRLKDVLFSDPKTRNRLLMEIKPKALRATDDRERAVRVMDKYDEPMLPVVDDQGKLLGVVTFDDVAEVAEEEFTEDIQKLGGMEALDEPYITASLNSLLKKRGIWLVVLFAGQMGTVTVLASFQGIVNAGILAIFIPLIISSGGNSGSQATNMIIRALAVGELKLKDWGRVLRREMLSGLLLGSMLGVLGLVRVFFGHWFDLDGHVTMSDGTELTNYMKYISHLGFTVGTALVGVVILGSSLGSMLPFILKKLKVDPATASGPFVATMVDVTGLIIYCTLALALMPKLDI